MSEKLPEGCATCANEKTVHLTQIVGGSVNKLDLCEACPWAKKVATVEAVNIVCEAKPELELSGGGLKSIDRGLVCPECGFTQESFKESGRLGCPSCYEVFSSSLETVFRKAHRGLTHKGKVPAGFEIVASPEEIALLKQELQEHVDREEYEKAAELRDRILELETRLA